MRKLILNWLFGTDNIEKYMELLDKSINQNQEQVNLIKGYLKTLDEAREDLNIIRKLIQICENHGIDVDEEIKHIEL